MHPSVRRPRENTGIAPFSRAERIDSVNTIAILGNSADTAVNKDMRAFFSKLYYSLNNWLYNQSLKI